MFVWRNLVRSVKGVQYHPRLKDTEICQRDKSKKRDRGESGAETEFRHDVCVGFDGEVLDI